MNSFKMIFGTFMALCLAILASAEPYYWADNVCNQSVPIKKDVMIETPIQYEIQVSSMCGILPCKKTRHETRTDQSIKTIVEYINKLTCCPGYVETANRRCSPICLEPCGPAGKCIAPNVCLCQRTPTESAPGFTGRTCRRFTCLSENRWGASCERECQTKCGPNMFCSADLGKCVCEPGWHGANCSLECSPNDDVLNSECSFMSQIPPIIEPDANLVADSSSTSMRTRKAEALILASEDGNDVDMDVKVVPKPYDSQAWAASSFLIGFLCATCFILMVALFIATRRSKMLRNELYYASATSSVGRSVASPGSDYSNSTYYSAQSPSTMSNLDSPNKNLSFATATRNLLSGVIQPNQVSNEKKVFLLAPRTESHLIRSQKTSEQNIYTELFPANKIDSDMKNRSRAKTPTIASPTSNDDGDHIYQVPKRSLNNSMSNTPDTSAIHTAKDDSKQGDVSIDLGDDNESNIYEELKPRNQGNF